MTKKKKYLFASIFIMFALGYVFRPTIVVRENYMAGGPQGFGAGRSIASVGAAAEPKTFSKSVDANLIRATQHFCDKQYHKESCLSFLIQCGSGCLDFVSNETKEKMRLEIKNLKAANSSDTVTK